ncbi:2-hydroxy-3-oxopropionate reductase [Novosphingobium sp. RD2P27]|uniref:2-hydroxy-3-oxopropionate reductase n=1 Tax=Novosphingobium kalidii TaxID=3230299 RepID=A0ABV2D1U4_9SPHN
MNIGFIGVGIMGKPMAGHLQKAGHTVAVVQNKSPLPEALVANGAVVCGSAREVAEKSEVIIVMVPDTPDVERVLFGEAGVAEGLNEGSLVIDMSSIDPIATREFAKRIAAKGCQYVDAPVSGGQVGAENAALTIMCGGEEDAFARALPLLKLMGKNITHVGGVGDGQVAKVANQIIVALNIEAVSEGLVFASKAGADPEKVRGALLGGFASSRVLEVHGERMVKRTFDPGFRIELHQKDLNLALDGARKLGIGLPSTALCQQLFSACVAQGGKSWDHSALVRAIEALGNHEIGS